MKKFFRFGLISLALALCVGGGYLVAKANKEPEKVAEASAVSFSFTKIREVALQLDDDPTYGTSSGSSSWTSPGSDVKHSATATGGHITASLGENSSSRKWHGVFVEYSYTFTYSAYCKTTLTFTYSLSSYRDSTSGEADHVMEFIHEGYSSSTGNTYTLNTAKDDPGTASSPNSNLLGSPVAYRVNSRTSGTVSSGSQTFTRTLDHTGSTGGSYTFYLAFFSYIETSSYAHTHTGQATLDLSITETAYDVQYMPSGGNTYYDSFTAAWNAVNSNTNGGTIKLLRDVDVSSGFNATKNVTLNLNGYSITRNGSGSHDNRYATIFSTTENSGKTLVITNDNKSTGGYVSTNYSTSTIWVNAGSTLTVCDGATIRNTYGVSGGGHGVVVSGGTFNLLSSSVVGADSASSTTNSCVLLRNGAKFYMSGGTIAGGSYSVRSDNSSSSIDEIHLGGMCTIQRNVGLIEGKVELYMYYNNSTLYNSGSSVLKLQFLTSGGGQTLPTTNGCVAKGLANMATYTSKLSVVGTPDYMVVSYASPHFYYSYRQYTINFNLSHLAASNTATGSHASNYSTTLSVNGDATLWALPQTISVNRAGTALAAGTDYTYNNSTGAVVIYAASFTGTQSLSLVAQAKRTNKGLAYDFIDAYMHMTDYTEELGYCSDYSHHYYTNAKSAFNALEKAVRAVFGTSDDAKIVAARERLIAWAHANGEDLAFDSTNGYTLHASQTIMKQYNNNNTPMLVVVISALALITLIPLGFFLIRKRKHQ